jgi:short subunit dehydrogenase-like uncharacterized protein
MSIRAQIPFLLCTAMSIPPRDARKYDLILYGATGFTGELCAQYLAGETGRKQGGRARPLVWALAGRDAKKLERVKSSLEIEEKVSEEPDIIIADANDQQSMQRMTAQTRVVLSTVGPFAKYGTPLIAACVKTGTDYADTTGEAPWVADMIAQYSEQAEKNGALLVNMCGFDSVPSDLGAYLVATYLQQEKKTNVGRMQGYAYVKGGGISGGTIASIINMLEDPKSGGAAKRRAYLLNPEGTAPSKTRASEVDQKFPVYDELLGKWTAPWLMAQVNTRVARRSIGLRKLLDPKGVGYGEEASYNETMPLPSAFWAFATWLGLVVSILLLVLKPTRRLLQRFVLPSPGEGPSPAQRERTTFQVKVIGVGENGDEAVATISGGDPGYAYTARMVSECALMLCQDRSTLEINQLVSGSSSGKKKGSTGVIGGFYTPAIVGGQLLAERLRVAGLGVAVSEYKRK